MTAFDCIAKFSKGQSALNLLDEMAGELRPNHFLMAPGIPGRLSAPPMRQGAFAPCGFKSFLGPFFPDPSKPTGSPQELFRARIVSNPFSSKLSADFDRKK